MKKIAIIFSLLFTCIGYAQTLNENYTNAANWTRSDDPSNRVTIAGGVLNHNSDYGGQWDWQSLARITRPLNGFLNNSENFRVDLNFQHTVPNLSAGMTVLALTQNNSPSFITHNNTGPLICHQNSSITIISGMTLGTPNQYNLSLQLKPRDAGAANNCPNSLTVSFNPNVPANTVKFLSLVRDVNAYRLSLYSNANRDTLIFDTVICSNIIVDSLNFIQHGNHPWGGWGRSMNTTITNLSIRNGFIDTSLERKCPRRCQDSCNWSLNGNQNVRVRNFIGSINSADFKIRTNNLERMTVEANGNIGIGTDLPSEQLHTTNGVRFQGLTPLDTPNRVIVQDNTGKLFWRNAATIGNNGNFWSITGNSNAITPGVGTNQNFIGTRTNHRLVFGTGNTNNTTSERMTILNNTGNVGIGISNPSILSKLHIVNEANWGANSTVLGTYNQAKVSGVAGNLGNTWAHAASMNEFEINTSGVFNDINAGGSSIAANNFTIFKRSTGTINVPVTGCISTLGLDGSGRINQYSAYRDRGAVALWGSGNSCTVDNYYGLYLSAIPQNLLTQTTGKAYGIYQLGNTSTNIFEGNVGIGTLTPNNKLEITHTTVGAGNTGNSGLRFTNLRSGFTPITNPGTGVLSVNANGDVIYVTGGGGLTNACSINNAGMLPRYNGANSLTCSQIFDNGTSVGINTRTGTVAGSFNYVTTGTTWFGPLIANGTVRLDVAGVTRSTSYIATSDGKLKTNIQEIPNSLDLVKQLNGKAYLWTKQAQKELGADNGVHTGFIAQEIQKVLPNVVITDESGKLGVNYDEITPILVEAIKELNAKVEKQNNAVVENEELKVKIAMMEEKFVLLEKTITQLCESGCEGLKKAGSSSDEDVLYQSIPNPTESEALINYHLSREYSDASISVSSQDGKQLMTLKLEAKKGAGSIKINLGELANGTYLYTLVAGERVIDTKRLQIIK